MNQQDLAQIKRRLNPEHRHPTVIRGCYINAEGETLSTFVKPVAMLPETENEKYMGLFRKVLSGTQGQNLLSVDFSAAQTMDDEAHALLTSLCRSELSEDEPVEQMFAAIRNWMKAEKEARPDSVEESQNQPNQLILMLYDSMDVPHRNRDGSEDRTRSESVFNYMLCCVCPVKLGKPALSYQEQEGDFHCMDGSWSVSAPEIGFMFPAYEQGGADIYQALYYVRSMDDTHDAFVQHVFHSELQMRASDQRDTVHGLISDTLMEECSMEVVQAVHEKVGEMIKEAKSDKTAEPVSLSAREVRTVLEDCGVTEEKAEKFENQFTESFGSYAEIPAVNLVTPSKFQVETPSVSIKVDPEHADLVSTRVIDGQRYILILADGAVEVNGIQVAIN